jgi:RNA polymerase sigma factor (sigma-70 family)
VDEDGVDEDGDLARLKQGFHAGILKFGDLDLPLSHYSSAVRDRIQQLRDRDGPVLWEKLQLADLYLVIACEVQLDRALEKLLHVYTQPLLRLLRHQGASHQEALDGIQEMPSMLFTRAHRTTARSRLAGYSGRASLQRWLGVLVLNALADRRRQRQRGTEVIRQAGAHAAQKTVASPFTAVASQETSQQIDRSLLAAWGQLTSRERLCLLYKFRDELSQRVIARLLRVGEPRVSRILKSGLDKLRAAIRQDLGQGWTQLTPLPSDVTQSASESMGFTLRRLATPPSGETSQGGGPRDMERM